MRKAFGVIALLLGIFIIAVLLIALTKPPAFSVSRSVVIAAPPEKIKPLIDNFHNFAAWSPWQDLDPNMQTIYGGSDSGPGASLYWKGNRKAGEGRMTILSSTPTETDVQLDFIKPFQASNTTTYVLTPQTTSSPTGSTQVTWTMTGPMTLMSKVMCVFVSMDKMVGSDFERGLAKMKAIAEK